MFVSIRDTKTNQIIGYPDSIRSKSFIEFTTDQTLIFRGACNGGSGRYSIHNKNLQISGIMTSALYCFNSSLWEDYLFYNLLSAYEYNITSDGLEIYSNDSYHLKFVLAMQSKK